MKAIWALALILVSGGAAIVKTQTDVAGIRNGQVTAAAYRDGTYLGRLAAENGEPAHVSIARWSTVTNRELFSAGYENAYAQQTAKNRLPDREDNIGVLNHATNAAFRDGLYVGKSDAARGNVIHLAVARWSTKENRTASRFPHASSNFYDISWNTPERHSRARCYSRMSGDIASTPLAARSMFMWPA